jgi:hypothetical protein
MQLAELRAALKCQFVLNAIEKNEKPLQVPKEADLTVTDRATTAGRASTKKMEVFIKWWAPEEFQGISAIRRTFLHREIIYAFEDETLLDKYKKLELITQEEINTIKKKIADLKNETSESGGIVTLEGTDLGRDEAFFSFRSWYKGGQVRLGSILSLCCYCLITTMVVMMLMMNILTSTISASCSFYAYIPHLSISLLLACIMLTIHYC